MKHDSNNKNVIYTNRLFFANNFSLYINSQRKQKPGKSCLVHLGASKVTKFCHYITN